MERWKKRSVELVAALLFGRRGEMPLISPYPQKTEVTNRDEYYFERTVPEKMGISSRRLYNMLCELESERRAGVHSLMVLCDGRVICECSADGYSVREWHVSHSMAKTVCGMIIGRLIDEGVLRLDTTLTAIFPEIPYRDRKFPLITIEHLLSMTTGVDFAEAGAITESDWTSAFFSSAVKFTPGAKFAYNSMNSYVLARIAERITGRSFISLAEEYIFAPMGIKSYLWERGPEGTEKGGWGLYLSPESWAKLGYMLLSGGIFMGRRILSEEWVRDSTTVKAITPESMGNFNYAYHVWTGRDNGEILFNGMLGQNVWICPKNKIIVVITSGNNEFFQESPALDILRKYLGGKIEDSIDQSNIKPLLEKQKSFFNCRRWVRPKKRGRGIAYLLGLRSRTEFDESWNQILGSYATVNNEASIMPLLLRVLQNNLGTVIEKIEILKRGEDLIMKITEGSDISITVGLYEYKSSVCTIGNEKYLIRAMGEATRSLRGEAEYRIELIFPETANARMIVIRQREEGVIGIELSERPNHRLAQNVLRRYRETSGAISFAADMIERRIGERELERMIKRAFNPILVGVSTSLPDFKQILDEKSNLKIEESGAVKMIRTVVDRFFRDNIG